jgi:hypothetical protein
MEIPNTAFGSIYILIYLNKKQKKGFEPSTLTLARLYSTIELFLQIIYFFIIKNEFNNKNNSLLFFTLV